MNIEKKKEELRKHSSYKEELSRKYEELNEIRIKCYNKAGIQAITYTDMPKGGETPDMADEIAKMIDLEKSIIKTILRLHKKISKIDDAIEDLKDIALLEG